MTAKPYQSQPCGTCGLHHRNRDFAPVCMAVLKARVERYRKALERLESCDWVITLPDRMDAVRAIAREALINPPDGDNPSPTGPTLANHHG